MTKLFMLIAGLTAKELRHYLAGQQGFFFRQQQQVSLEHGFYFPSRLSHETLAVTLATGSSVIHHQISHCQTVRADGQDLVHFDGQSWQSPPVWQRLSQQGLKCVSVAWPNTLASPVEAGLVISDEFLLSTSTSYDDWACPIGAVNQFSSYSSLFDLRLHYSEIPPHEVETLLSNIAVSPQTAQRLALLLAKFSSSLAVLEAVIAQEAPEWVFLHSDLLTVLEEVSDWQQRHDLRLRLLHFMDVSLYNSLLRSANVELDTIIMVPYFSQVQPAPALLAQGEAWVNQSALPQCSQMIKAEELLGLRFSELSFPPAIIDADKLLVNMHLSALSKMHCDFNQAALGQHAVALLEQSLLTLHQCLMNEGLEQQAFLLLMTWKPEVISHPLLIHEYYDHLCRRKRFKEAQDFCFAHQSALSSAFLQLMKVQLLYLQEQKEQADQCLLKLFDEVSNDSALLLNMLKMSSVGCLFTHSLLSQLSVRFTLPAKTLPLMEAVIFYMLLKLEHPAAADHFLQHVSLSSAEQRKQFHHLAHFLGQRQQVLAALIRNAL